MAKVTPLSGFPEWLPAERRIEQHVMDTFREVAELHGFSNIETRAVEPLDQLLRKGAIALTAGQDILAEYGWDSVRSETRSMQASLTSAEQALLEKIRPDESVTAEQLAAETSLPVPELMRLLLQLQMKNVVEDIAGSDYIRKETV